MNIVFIYNLENKEFEEITIKIEENIKNKIRNKVIYTNRKNKVNTRLKADIYIILSDDYNEVDKYFEKIKSRDKSIILTNNISSSTILNFVKNTKNICYMKNEINILVRKIYNVYEESSEKYL